MTIEYKNKEYYQEQRSPILYQKHQVDVEHSQQQRHWQWKRGQVESRYNGMSISINGVELFDESIADLVNTSIE